jgi:hypothetical protein
LKTEEQRGGVGEIPKMAEGVTSEEIKKEESSTSCKDTLPPMVEKAST